MAIGLRFIERPNVTLHVQWLGDKALLPREELERLVELARRSEAIAVETNDDENITAGIQLLAAQSGAFAWLADEPDLYSLDDLKVRYR